VVVAVVVVVVVVADACPKHLYKSDP